MKQKKSVAVLCSYVSIALFILSGVGLGIYTMTQGNVGRGILGLASPLFLVIPVAFHLLGLGHPSKLYTVLFAFMVLAYSVGCVYQGFEKFDGLDKIAHFISGILFTIIGFCIYFYLNAPRMNSVRDNWISSATYALFFSTFVAVIWEISEFVGYLLTGHDAQHHLTTGVFDTMGDLVSCMIASIISVLSFVLFVKKNVKLVTGSVVSEFFESAVSTRFSHLFVKKENK